MISTEDIEKVMGWMQQARIASLRFEQGDEKICLKFEGATGGDKGESHVVTSPAVGRFETAHPRLLDQIVSIGDRVIAGDIVGYVRADRTLRAITADRDGIVVSFAQTNGALVGVGTPILTIS